MSITSIAFNFFSQVAPAPAPATAPVAPAASAPAPAPRSCETHGHEHGRRNVLYEAMMAALRELGLTSNPPPAPTGPAPVPGPVPLPMPAPAAAVAAPVVATTPSPAPSVGATTGPVQPGTPPAVSVEEAVYSFAHALWQALRGADSGSRREHRGDDDDHGHHGHRRHGHDEHGYGMSRGYSGLATRLESLAVRLDTNTAGVTPAPTPPGTPTTPTPVSPVATPVVPAAQVPTPVPTPTPTPAPATSPLAQAFDAMMRVLRSLNPSAPSTETAAPSLASFLHSLARGLGADTTMPALSGVGIVINISA